MAPTAATASALRGPERTASGASAGGLDRAVNGAPASGKKERRLGHHLWFVVGYNWLVAVTIAPLAFAAAFTLSVVIPEAVRNPWRPPPVAVLCVAGYIFFEVTSFSLERNWSHVSIWRFWRVAVPLGALQTFLCLWLARHDALGCLLFVSLCLGCREFLFEFQSFYPVVGKYYLSDGCTKEKLMSAFFDGSAYGMAVALLCGLAGALVHAVVGDGRKVLSAIYIDILIALALPLGRNLSRMVLNQSLAGAISSGPVLAGAERPKLDALVMYGDILFMLTMFMEVPFAFAFLLVPRTITFCLALALNVLLDVLFVQALDVVQRRSPAIATGLPSAREIKSARDDTKSMELGVWSPTYCIERPESIFATLSSGVLLTDSSETTSLRQPPVSLKGFFGRCPRRCQDFCCLSRSAETAEEGEAAEAAGDAMSPRVSLLLDEHNAGVIGCWAGRTELSRGSGLEVFLRQERKVAFTTHFLGSTLAVVVVTVAIPVAKYASDHHRTEFLGLHHISATELAIRAVAVLALRVIADLIALRLLDLSSTEPRGGEAPSLWESRHELSTFHGWFFRALATTCPLFAVIAATL